MPHSISPETIGSLSHRNLLKHYWHICTGRRFPALGDFIPNARHYDPEQLVLWEVESRCDGHVFKAMAHGQHVRSFVRERFEGRTIEDIAPPSLKQILVNTASSCAVSGRPVYSVVATQNASGQRIDLERLLLPFGIAGLVRHILILSQLISIDGSFQRSSVKDDFARSARETVVFGMIRDTGQGLIAATTSAI